MIANPECDQRMAAGGGVGGKKAKRFFFIGTNAIFFAIRSLLSAEKRSSKQPPSRDAEQGFMGKGFFTPRKMKKESSTLGDVVWQWALFYTTAPPPISWEPKFFVFFYTAD